MKNNGWIKLHRKFIKWGWYQKSEMVHLFLHFLLLANHEESDWQGNKIKKGQFITGLDKLKQDTGISAQTLRTCIGRLKSTGEITNKSTNKFRLITLINWEHYQDKEIKSTSKSTSKLTNNQQTTNKQLTANKKLKNIKNDKEDKEDNDFEIFYKAFPIKKGKEQAKITWNKLTKAKKLPKLNVLLKAIELQITEKKQLKAKEGFAPNWKYPSSWLNAFSWEDEIIIKDNSDWRTAHRKK